MNDLAYRWQAVYDEVGIETPPFDDRPLGSHVEEHARERGDNVALQFFDKEITYHELNELANRLANALVARGVSGHDVYYLLGRLIGRFWDRISIRWRWRHHVVVASR